MLLAKCRLLLLLHDRIPLIPISDNHDIYRVFRYMRVCPTYELPFGYMSCHFLSNWNYGWICEPLSDMCLQEWQRIWTGWHDIWAAISHKKTKMTAHMRANPTYELTFHTKKKMAAHMRANPPYEQPFHKISIMSAHVSRMAAHMIVFCRFSALIS